MNIEALKYTSTSLEQKVFHQDDIIIDGAIASSSSGQQKISTSGANKPSAKGLDDTDIRMAEEVMLKLKKENIDKISALENFNISDIFEKEPANNRKEVPTNPEAKTHQKTKRRQKRKI